MSQVAVGDIKATSEGKISKVRLILATHAPNLSSRDAGQRAGAGAVLRVSFRSVGCGSPRARVPSSPQLHVRVEELEEALRVAELEVRAPCERTNSPREVETP